MRPTYYRTGYQGETKLLTQLRFIHNWVIVGIQWIGRWWVLVHCGQVIRRSVSKDTKYLPSSSFLFWGWRQANFDWPIVPQKLKLWRLLKIGGSVLMYIVPPFTPAYRWKENNICQSIWNKSVVLKWRTCWGTYWEPIRNLEGIPWEHIGTQGKMKKYPFRPPNLKGIETRHLGPSHWLKGKQIPPPPPNLAWKVHCPSRHWTVHSPPQIELEKKTSPPTSRQRFYN
jgi:hypothetical protein